MQANDNSNRGLLNDAMLRGCAMMLSLLATCGTFFALVASSVLLSKPTPGLATDVSILGSVLLATAWFLVRGLTTLFKVIREDASISMVMISCIKTFCLSLHVPLVVCIIALTGSHYGWDSTWLIPIAVLAAIIVPMILRAWLSGDEYRTEILRGSRLLTMKQAKRRAAVLATGNSLLNWCGLRIPDLVSVGHFLLVGAPGSGKTVSLRMLMQSVLPHIRLGSDWRAVVYDAKQDALPILSGMDLSRPVFTLNPFDVRGVAWDMAKDIDNPATALQVAANLIPEEQGHNSFFTDAARDLLAAVMIAFHLDRPGEWSLADVVLTLSSKKRAKELLWKRSETRHIARDYFSRDPRTLANIQQTITSRVSPLRSIAAVWAHAEQRISLHQWVNGEFILILANDESHRESIDALNVTILQRLTQLELAQPENSQRRSWFFLDELKEMGKVECIPRLMTKGRSKGIRCLLAFQTIEGLRSVYGQDMADDIVGLCTTKAFLRTDSIVTAKWAAEILGEAERREWRYTAQSGPNGRSSSMSEQIVKRETALASELMHMPLADRQRYHGYFLTPGIGMYSGSVPIEGRLLPVGSVPSFVPRPPEHQYLLDYDDDDADETDDTASLSLDEISMLWEDEYGTPDGEDEDGLNTDRPSP